MGRLGSVRGVALALAAMLIVTPGVACSGHERRPGIARTERDLGPSSARLRLVMDAVRSGSLAAPGRARTVLGAAAEPIRNAALASLLVAAALGIVLAAAAALRASRARPPARPEADPAIRRDASAAEELSSAAAELAAQAESLRQLVNLLAVSDPVATPRPRPIPIARLAAPAASRPAAKGAQPSER